MSCLNRFLIDNTLLYKDKLGDGKPYTHTLFSGGVINIPDDKIKEFNQALASDLKLNNTIYINELATEVTALYMDLDFKDQRPEDGSMETCPCTNHLLWKLFCTKPTANREKTFMIPPDLGPDCTIPTKYMIEHPQPFNKAFLLKMMTALQAVTRTYFPFLNENADLNDERLHCYVLTAPMKLTYRTRIDRDPTTGEITEYMELTSKKTGFHIIWPYLYATQEDLLHLRQGWLKAIFESCGERPSTGNTWDNVVDDNIYFPNRSLRMIYSDYCEKCSDCATRKYNQNSHFVKCYRCDNRTITPNGRPYIPSFLFDGKGTCRTLSDSEQRQYDFFVEHCCIRRPFLKPQYIHQENSAPVEFPDREKLLVFKVPEGAPRSIVPITPWVPFIKKDRSANSLASQKQILQMKKESNEIADRFADAKGTRKWIKSFMIGEKLVADVEAYLRSFEFDVHYRNIRVVSIDQHTKGTSKFYVVTVDGPGSKYCQNVKREHNTQLIYFLITRMKGIQQKCNCRCKETARNKIAPIQLCKDYASIPGVTLTFALQDVMFSEEENSNKIEKYTWETRDPLMLVKTTPESPFLFDPEVHAKLPTDVGTFFDFNTYASEPIDKDDADALVPGGTKRLARRWYPGDASLLQGRNMPKGMHYIPRDASYAPATPDDARQLLLEAMVGTTRKKMKQADFVKNDLVGSATPLHK